MNEYYRFHDQDQAVVIQPPRHRRAGLGSCAAQYRSERNPIVVERGACTGSVFAAQQYVVALDDPIALAGMPPDVLRLP